MYRTALVSLLRVKQQALFFDVCQTLAFFSLLISSSKVLYAEAKYQTLVSGAHPAPRLETGQATAGTYEAYRADSLSAFFIPLDEGEIYADDIQPLGGIVTVARYEVWLAGLEGEYEITTQLWSDSGPGVHPRPLVPILGAVGVFDGLGNGFAEQAIHELTPPVLMPTSRFWISYAVTGGHDAGPLIVGDYPSIGLSYDCFSTFGDPDPGEWSSCYECWSNCGGGEPCCTFHARVFAVGEEPSGACCDLFEDGPDCQDSVPFTQCGGRWIQDATCADADFDPPCGFAACCTIDEACNELVEQDCSMVGGLWQPGRFCDVGTQACPPPACITATNDCDEPTFDNAGCNIPSCCAHVCSIDDFCCTAAWDDTCVMLAADFGCEEVLLADECSYAHEVPCDGILVFDNSLATDALNDPPFSCHNIGLPHNGIGSVWAKFVATSSTARLRTCNSDGPAVDSLLAVYSGTCGKLTEIACNDNATGCGEMGFNSEICVSGLVPGETYYVQLASWTNAYRGQYTLELECPLVDDCGGDPPPNDDCEDAQTIGEGSFPLTTINAVRDGHGTIPLSCGFECIGCAFQGDIWYDFSASESGLATIDLCQESNFDSILAVYSGCDCPSEIPDIAACDDDGCGTIGESSSVTLPVTAGQCYKIRVAVLYGEPGSGTLNVSIAGVSCPRGQVTFVDPPNGLVDARAPQGPVDHQFFRVNGPLGGHQGCWSACDTVSGELDIVNFGTPGDGSYVIILPVLIATGAVTELTYTDDLGQQTTGRFIAHPGNVNGDTISGPTDILAIIDCFNGVNPTSNCPWGLYSGDINHSGQITPADILTLIDLFNGVVGCPPFPPCPPWTHSPLPMGTCTP